MSLIIPTQNFPAKILVLYPVQEFFISFITLVTVNVFERYKYTTVLTIFVNIDHFVYFQKHYKSRGRIRSFF